MANKQDVVSRVARAFDITKVQAEDIVMYALDTMADLAMDDGKVSFGPHKLTRKETAARKGRNPNTGEELTIPAKTKLVYKQVNR